MSKVRGRSQDSRLRIEVHVSQRRIVISGETEKVVRLRSRAQFGLVAFLVGARLGGREEGWRSDDDILAGAPGWSRVRQMRSVGKRFSTMASEHSELLEIIAAPEGITLPPWRIDPPPSEIRVDDLAGLERLLAERSGAPPTKSTQTPKHQVSATDLADLEAFVARTSDANLIRRRATAILQEAHRSRDPLVRAEAARIEAALLRRAGRLKVAQRRAEAAFHFFGAPATYDTLRLAAILNELGAIAYRMGDMSLAGERFAMESCVLREDGSRAALRARTRCLRCRALAASRCEAFDEGARFARMAAEAADRADDDVARSMARAVQYRLLAHGKDVDAAPRASACLRELANLTPVVAPAAVVFVRRMLLETLYLLEDEHAADRLALAVARDAHAIGSARDADAVVRLLRYHERRDALQSLRRISKIQPRDQIEDWVLIGRAQPVSGRPSAAGLRHGLVP